MWNIQILKLIICLFVSFSCQAKVLIWDLGDVLFKQSHFGFARSIGLGHFASYALGDWKNPNIKPQLFDVLNTFGCQESIHDQLICDAHGNHLPQIMCDWLTGKISPYDLIETAHRRIEELDTQDYFLSTREKRLIRETIRVIFDPYHFANHQKPINSAVRLLQECADYCDHKGEHHMLIVLSNWDSHSFDLLYEMHEPIFSLFHHVVISGDIGLAKPHNSCFEHLINTYKLRAEDCYFIDDQLTNIQAAQRCKMNGLWLQKGNYRELRRKMKDLGIL